MRGAVPRLPSRRARAGAGAVPRLPARTPESDDGRGEAQARRPSPIVEGTARPAGGGVDSPLERAVRPPAMKTVLVTGANKGIGKAICERLLAAPPSGRPHVLLGARSLERGEAAVESLKRECGSEADGRLTLLELDVSEPASVEAAAKRVAEEFGSLSGLVNNAGLGFGHGMENTLAVNFFGAASVTSAFLPLLAKEEGQGRIVNIASASGPNFLSGCGDRSVVAALTDPEVTWDELVGIAERYKGKPDGGQAYGLSKALLSAYTMLVAREHPELAVNACTPGFIDTDLTAGMGATNPPIKGTKAPLYLLFDEDLEGNGRFYGSDAQRSPLDRYREPGTPPYVGP